MKKIAIITGADGGMGREITRAVAEAGYPVLMLCYSFELAEPFRQELVGQTGNQAIEVMEVDLSSMQSVSEVADRILERGEEIALLMNNAGMLATHLVQTADGFENTVAVNYLAPYFLTRKLLPLMSRGSRIVSMVSCSYVKGRIGPDFFEKGKEGDFSRIPIYSNTKLALWYFTNELSRRVAGKGILVNCADPGIVNTEIIRMHKWFDCLTDLIYRPLIRTPREGADTAIRLLTHPDYQQETGKMFHSGKSRRIPKKFRNPSVMKKLWDDTECRLRKAGFELSPQES